MSNFIKSIDFYKLIFHYLAALLFLLGPVILYLQYEEGIMKSIQESLRNAHANSFSNIRTFLPFLFLTLAPIIFTSYNTLVAFFGKVLQNSSSLVNIVKLVFIAYFIFTGFVSYKLITVITDSKKLIANSIKDTETSVHLVNNFDSFIGWVQSYSFGMVFIFFAIDFLTLILLKKNAEDSKRKSIEISFVKNQLLLIDLPLFIGTSLVTIIVFYIRVPADWSLEVACYFSVGIIIMQIIFSQFVFIFLKSKYTYDKFKISLS